MEQAIWPARSASFASFTTTYARIAHAHTRSVNLDRSTSEAQRAQSYRSTSEEYRQSGEMYRQKGEEYRQKGEEYRQRGEINNNMYRQMGESNKYRQTGEDVRRAVQVHMNKKLAGYALMLIHDVQDFIAEFCGENDNGVINDEKKTIISELMIKLRPWVMMLGKLVSHKWLRMISEMGEGQHGRLREKDNNIIYLRFNLRNEAAYVGETTKWKDRVTRHYTATWRHNVLSKLPCKKCIEHQRYIKHRVAEPHEWMMIPIMNIQGDGKPEDNPEKKQIRLQMETWICNRYEPSINNDKRPFQYLNFRYDWKTDNQRKVSEKRRPWQRIKKHKQQREYKRTQRPFFQYIAEGIDTDRTFYNFESILKESEVSGNAINVTIRPGKHDLTKWKSAKEKYGETTIRSRTDGNTTSIISWKTRAEKNIKITVRAKLSQEHADISKAFKDIANFKRVLSNADEETLAFFWRLRDCTAIHDNRIKGKKILRDAIAKRYPNIPMKTLCIQLPYVRELDAKELLKEVRSHIQELNWPQFMKDWHKQNLRVTTTNTKSIEDILTNVNKPWLLKEVCVCKEIRNTLKRNLPETDGHILFTSKDYNGPFNKTFNVSANNTPEQTKWDLSRAWEMIRNQFPMEARPSNNAWNKMLGRCMTMKTKVKHNLCPSTKDVYTLRKQLKGLVIGQTDKNLHELWFCCPCLYFKAWRKNFTENQSYQKVYPRKMTKAAQRDKIVYQNTPPTKQSLGKPADIIKAWGSLYKQKRWDKITAFNKQGNFNIPYVLLKAKNLAVESREEKWKKSRPLTPATKHPMKNLFHITGKAWSYITSKIGGEHLVITKGDDVPRFYEEAQSKLENLGDIQYIIKDIEGCFPNMPKDIIRHALRDLLRQITKATGANTIYVPKIKRQNCTLKKPKCQSKYYTLGFETLMDIVEFALDNTLIQDWDGNLYKQIEGIPMGDPHSPGMCIGSCAWMEQQWLASLTEDSKKYFVAKRYMDDILVFYANCPEFDATKFKNDLAASECYAKPLKLEEAKEGTFLESSFQIKGNRIIHTIKNDNTEREPHKIWRYAHFKSYTPFQQKKAVLGAALKKVEKFSNTHNGTITSGLQKVQEFTRLQYPRKMIWSACTTMGVQSRNTAWFRIRDQLPHG